MGDLRLKDWVCLCLISIALVFESDMLRRKQSDAKRCKRIIHRQWCEQIADLWEQNMAKQTGIIKISGCIDDRVYYQMEGHYYVRSRDVMRSERIKNDDAFKTTRAYANEFSVAVKAANLFRSALRSLDPQLVPTQLQHNITRLFLSLKNSDASSLIGERSVHMALQSLSALKQLLDFMRRLKSKRFDLDYTELRMAGDCLQITFRGKKEGELCLWLDFLGMHFGQVEFEEKEKAARVWIDKTMCDVLTIGFEDSICTENKSELILDG